MAKSKSTSKKRTAAVAPPPPQSSSPSRSVSRAGSNSNGALDPWRLRDVDELPTWMRHNPYILTGYRVGYTTWMAVRSLFMLHNETTNVWTHFIGFMVVLAMTAHLYAEILQDVWSHHALFFVFVAANFFVFAFSTSYHLCACVSEKHYDVLMALDYMGISSLLLASFIPSIWFAFACHPTERTMYLTAIGCLGSASLILPFFKFWDSPAWFWRRIFLYCGIGASGVIPAVHTWLMLPPTVLHAGVALMFISYALGVIFYLSKFPERMWPGRFDYFCNSHSIWHWCVGCAALCHYATCIGIYQRFTTLDQVCS